MAKLSAKEIIDSLKEMSLLEIKEVVDLMKEEFGVDPSAVAVAAPAAGAEAASEGPSTVDVVLASAGANKIAVIKIIKETCNYTFKRRITYNVCKWTSCNPKRFCNMLRFT